MKAKQLLILLYALIMVTTAWAASFTFSPDPSGQTFLLNQSLKWTYDLNVSINESLVVYTMEVTNFSNLSFSNETGIINLIANNDEIGNYSGGTVFIATNRSSGNDYITTKIYFNISNVNDPPNITLYQPLAEAVSVNENYSIGFSFNISYADIDVKWGDILVADWYINGALNKTNSDNMTYFPNFCDAGSYNITVIVQDSGNLSARHYWNVTVTNVNRPPVLNRTIGNITWYEDTNLIDNLTLTDYFYDPDRSECSGANKDNISFRAYNNDSISVNINSTTFNVSLYPAGNLSANVTIYFSINDSLNISYSNNLTLNVMNVNDPPELLSIGNKTAATGVLRTIYVTAVDPDIIYGDILTFSDNATIFNISSYNSTSGVISYLATSPESGNYTINISVNDSAGIMDFEVINFEVKSNSPPVLETIGSQTLTQGAPYSKIISATDADNNSITFSENTGLFDFQTYNSTAVLISFTPSNSQVDNYSVNISVVDSNDASDSELVTFVVNNANDDPVLDPIGNKQLKVDELFILYVNATDIDLLTPYSDTLTFSDNATIFNISYYNATTALINFTPSQNDNGSYSVTITVTDALGATDYEIMLFNVSQNLPPVLAPIGNHSLTEDHFYMLNVTVSDANEDDINFSINISALNVTPINITYLNRTRAYISITPSQYDIGVYTIRFNVTDTGNLSDYEDINLTVLEFNDPPILLSIGNITGMENVTFTKYLYATDEENSNLTFRSNVSFFNITYINKTTSFINFTPIQSNVGNHSINISVSDGASNDSEVINFEIVNVDTSPVISFYRPLEEQPSVMENSSLIFNVTAYDPDGLNVTYNWYVDTLLNSTVQNFTYLPGFCDAGRHNITLVVNDSAMTNSHYWNVTVNNTNRPPVFGKKIFSTTSKFNGGYYYNTTNNSASSNANITLALNGSYYYLEGSYISSVIDFRDDNVYVNTTTIEWDARVPEGANVTLATRTSTNNLVWTNWSAGYTRSGEGVNATPGRYIQFRINLSTANVSITPEVYGVTVNYVMGNHTFLQKYNEIGWIDLDDYFFDPDADECSGSNRDNLSSSAIGNFSIIVTIAETKRVSLYSENIVTEVVMFYVNDSMNVTYSNNVTLDATRNAGYTGGQQVVYVPSGGGGTSVISELNLKETEKPFAFDILVPEEVTIYENNTLVTPITIRNDETFILKKIRLNATSSNKNIKLNFSVDFFNELGPGNQTQTDLYITSYATYGSYEVVVTAKIDEPKFNDSVKFFVNSYELGEKNKTQLNTRIAFTRDLFREHPECLELNELLERAVKAIDNSQYSEASKIIDQVIEDCRYLISVKEKAFEKPVQNILQMFLTNRMAVYISAAVAFMFIAFGIFVVYLYRKSMV